MKTEVDLDVLDYARQKEHCTFQPNQDRKSTSNSSMGKSKMKSISLKSKPEEKMVFQMEVKVGKVVDKIVIRKKDNVGEVLRQFKSKHKLSDHKEKMLLDFILSQMNPK